MGQFKRRRLKNGQSVIIIYTKSAGFLQESAVFINYKSIKLGERFHETPIFSCFNTEISGLDCFWVMPGDINSEEDIENVQYDIIKSQVEALILCEKLGYNMPNKLVDVKMQKVAKAAAEQTAAIIAKFGFDPRDTSWIEEELASSQQEKNWFKYERENNISPEKDWDKIVSDFNKLYFDSLTVSSAKELYKKRMRYILGSYNTRMSTNSDKKAWKQSAIDFESLHRTRENRMNKWSENRNNNFPKARVIKPIRFWHGPYFNTLIEKIPNVFTSTDCSYIKEGTILRVISYDPELKYIRLDFTEDVSKLIRPLNETPWIKESGDYDFWLSSSEINTHLQFIDPLV